MCLWYLVILAPVQEMSGYVHWEDVVQQTLIVFTQLPHILHFLLGLQTPQEVQPGSSLPLENKVQIQRGLEITCLDVTRYFTPPLSLVV